MAVPGDSREAADVTKLVRENGWRQGDVFEPSLHQMLEGHVGESLAGTSWVIVLSQSCDVLHGNLEAEPYVEVIVGHPSCSDDQGIHRNLRNPRRIQIDATAAGREIEIDLHAAHRAQIPKYLCAHARPDPHRKISHEGLQELIRWAAARYDRRAFPDAFMDRLDPAKKSLDKIWKRLCDVHSVYLAISSYEELPTGATYDISIIGVMMAADYEDVGKRAAMEKGLADLVAAIGKCTGINVVSTETRPEGEVTLEEARYFGRWYLDTYSSRDPAHKMPPGNG